MSQQLDDEDEHHITYNKKAHQLRQKARNNAVAECVDRTPATASKKQRTANKDLIKINSNRKTAKKKLIGELTFVEPHVDTFYIGLNDDWKNNLMNPMQAKVLNVEDNENANELVKNWVNPDTNLLRSRKKSKIPVFNSTNRTKATIDCINKKMCPLEFVDCEDNRNKISSNVNQIEQYNHEPNEMNAEKESLLRKVANDLDKTDFACSNKTPLKAARILVNDTPVEYYGISVIERRKLGI